MFSFHVMCYVWGNRMVFGLGIEETGETQQLLKEKRLLYLWKPSDTTPNFLWHQNDQNGGCCVFGVFPQRGRTGTGTKLPGISWVTCPASASFKVVRQLLAKSADPPRSHGMPAMSDSVRRCPTVRRGWSRSIPMPRKCVKHITHQQARFVTRIDMCNMCNPYT